MTQISTDALATLAAKVNSAGGTSAELDQASAEWRDRFEKYGLVPTDPAAAGTTLVVAQGLMAMLATGLSLSDIAVRITDLAQIGASWLT